MHMNFVHEHMKYATRRDFNVDFTFLPPSINTYHNPASRIYPYQLLRIESQHISDNSSIRALHQRQEERGKMVTEEDIHRYHMCERVYGIPLPIPSGPTVLDNGGQSSKGKARKTGTFTHLLYSQTDQ